MRSKMVPVLLSIGVLLGCGGEPDRTGDGPAGPLRLPGERTFPEGIAVDKATGDLYVGSTTDGTVFRSAGGDGPFEVFLAGREDGRTAATGLKVDPRGRLFVAGRGTGLFFVYDLATKRLLKRLRVPEAGPTLLNDLTFARGAAYVTDSAGQVIYRIGLEGERIGELMPWLRLAGTRVPTGKGFGLNGISASDDGRFLLTVDFDSGRLFRIEVATRAVREVDLIGGRLRTGDGLLLDGRRLLAVREEPGDVVPVTLDATLTRGELGEPLGAGRLDLPTTLAEQDGTIYVVNSQLDDAPDRADPPFTVSVLPASF